MRRDAATLPARRAARRSPAGSRSSRVILIGTAMLTSANHVQSTANHTTADQGIRRESDDKAGRIRGVEVELRRGETLGLVGESGSR